MAPNIEFYELDPPPNPHRKPWPRPYPSVAGYSLRDYGNRVGHMRQMKLLDKYGIKGSISVNRSLRAPPGNYQDVFGAGLGVFLSWDLQYTLYLRYDRSPGTDMIMDSMETIFKHTGQQCSGLSGSSSFPLGKNH